MNSLNSAFRLLPSVDQVLQRPELADLIEVAGREPVKTAARELLADLREALKNEKDRPVMLEKIGGPDYLRDFCLVLRNRVEADCAASLLPVLNLTGTVIHTNLGRAPLPENAIRALSTVAGQPCNLEYDLEQGKRGDRDAHLCAQICAITGAEDATVVNNNAAAVVLVLNSLAENREVIISRGELVEIGGSFRIPDVMRSAHARLREVGTTNRTHQGDYEDAIGPDTALLMKVHTSNYAVQGFTASVSEQELARIADQHDLPFVTDLGSGTLIDLSRFGLPAEPTVQQLLTAGADLVTFSGDKLLGGPQAGIIAGRRDLIARIKRNPLKRALRVDKLIIAALSEVLALYRDPDRLPEQLPVLRALTRDPQAIRRQAEALLPLVREHLRGIAAVDVTPTRSQIGSGALPLDLLPSFALTLRPIAESGGSDHALRNLALAFRRLPVPVIGRLHDGNLHFDLRCLEADQESFLAQLPVLRAGYEPDST